MGGKYGEEGWFWVSLTGIDQSMLTRVKVVDWAWVDWVTFGPNGFEMFGLVLVLVLAYFWIRIWFLNTRTYFVISRKLRVGFWHLFNLFPRV